MKNFMLFFVKARFLDVATWRNLLQLIGKNNFELQNSCCKLFRRMVY